MKKLLSVLLMVSMLLCSASVFAESETEVEIVPAFKLITVVPDGYESEGDVWLDPFMVYTTLKPVDESKPAVMTFISYNDSESDITFNADMPDEEFNKKALEKTMDEETGEQKPYTVQETGLGTRVLLISDEDDGYMEFFSIWHGYEVSLLAANFKEVDGVYVAEPLTDEQIAVIMQYLTDMDFQTIIQEIEEPAA